MSKLLKTKKKEDKDKDKDKDKKVKEKKTSSSKLRKAEDRKSKIFHAEQVTAATADGPPSRPPPSIGPKEGGLGPAISGDFAKDAAPAEVEQDEPGLIFTGELENGRPVIKGGSIEKLVERLTYEKYHDVKFVKAFLLTFRSFTTPQELLQLLIDRFNVAPPSGSSTEEIAAFEGAVLKVVRLRVFNVLKQWLNTGFYDFQQDTELKKTLVDFIQNQIQPTMENAATSLTNIISKKALGDREYAHIFTGDPPESILPTGKADNILAFHPLELARQMTLIEYRLFAAINPSECVSQHWMAKRKEELAPNILKMIHRFNEVSTWVQSEIVKCVDLPTRIQILRHVISVAEHCKELNNFNAVMEIISGLHSSSVFRMKNTWGGLKKDMIASYEEMEAITSRDFSYKAFRTVLKTVNPPCIPYLGMYLTDLTFIEEGNSDKLPDGSINFTKRQRLAEVISDIQTYQNTPYFLKEVPSIRSYLENAEALPEEQCYKLSLKREPRRGTNAAADIDIPDLPFGDMESKPGYLFEKEDNDEVIRFEKKEAADGTSVPIIAATLVKLVERLTFHEYQDSSLYSFLGAFLMTLQTFTTPSELLDLLDNRFQMPKPKNPSKQQLEKFNKTRLVPIHVRIFNMVKSWINTYPEDFFESPELQQRLNEKLGQWSESNTTLKPIVEGVRKLLEKKMSEPLPTPECRFIGFLYGESDEYEGKTVLDYDEETLAQQITLIEQNFFASIRPRECLCSSFDPEVMEIHAPNILGIKQNFDVLRRFTLTQILSQPTLETKYRAVTTMVLVAEKLLGFKVFTSSMAITAGLQYLSNEYPELWAWVPIEVIDKYKELELLLRTPKRLKVLEKGEDKVPTIPFIDLYITQLTGISNLMSDFTGTTNQLINFERRRKQWEVFRVLETYQGIPYTFEYSGPCGGFLYHCGVCDDEAINQALSNVERPAPPEIRPELRDFRVSTSSDSAQDYGMSLDEGNTLSPSEQGDEHVASLVKEYLLQVLKDKSDDLQSALEGATRSLAESLMGELQNFKLLAEDQLSLMHAQLGVCDNPPSAQRIISRVFPSSNYSEWIETDTKGSVYGWKDQVVINKVQQGKQVWLVHIASHIDKHEASAALRLFQFFSALEPNHKPAIIAATIADDARSVLLDKNVSIFNLTGEQM